MASAPLEPSSSPPSPMTESSRTRSDSLEEAEALKTRKRPRLDSNDRASSEQALADSDSSRPEGQTSTMLPSSNQVTINTRSPAVPPPDHAIQDSDLTSEGTVQADDDTADSDRPQVVDVAHQTATDPVEPISISSSPAHSPEIEVAELEDIDESPAISRWKALGHADTIQDLVHEGSYVEDSFPYADRFNGDTQRVVEELAQTFYKGHPQGHDNKWFLEVKNWLENFLRQHESLSYEAITEDRLFWDTWPTIVDALLKRRSDLQIVRQNNIFEEFLVSFARLALRFVDLDTRILQDYVDAEPVSRPYLEMLSHILQFGEGPFYLLLTTALGFNHVNLVATVNDRIVQPPIHAIQRFSVLADALLKDLPQRPALASNFVALLSVVHYLVKSGPERRQHEADEALCSSRVIPTTNLLAYSVLSKVDEGFQQAISKQSSWLTIENSADILRNLSGTYACIAESEPSFASQIMSDLAIDAPDAEPPQLPELITFAWKFRVLKKYITTGRMELRVHGMETMQNDLVYLWKTHIQFRAAGISLPIIQYLVKFLRDNKLVEYIVGVDSHPQLISRSGNVVGFLVVTSTYTNADTDIIWRTVTESQDPRTVTEVLRMLDTTLNMHSLPSLVYLCEKLIDMPLTRFDAKLLDYTARLTNCIRLKNHSENGRAKPLPVVVFRLCVRIIRESSNSKELSPDHRANLQVWAVRQLSELLYSPIDDADKHEMLETCIRDVAEKNAYATGSLQALNVLYERPEASEIWKLASEFDFTRLLIEEVSCASKRESFFSDSSFSENGLAVRLMLLAQLILSASESLTPELSDLLWNSVYISGNLGEQARSLAWENLSNVTRLLRAPNSFVERFIKESLPMLTPDMMSSQVLAFVSASIDYDIQFSPPSAALEGDIINIPGVDRVWRFILTAPDGPVVSEATKLLMQLYLDHHSVIKQTRQAVEATHVFLVDHCVKQLTSAATKLKSFCDGSSSGDDEGMIIVPTEEEAKAEELRFSRSLQFLRQFLQGLRMRPQYSPPRPKAPEIPERKFELQGDEIVVPYQAFGGSRKTPSIENLRIGDLNTAAELADYIGDLTGFVQFTTIVGGGRVELFGNASTLRDLKIGKSGMLIVRQVPGTREKNSAGRRQSLTLVDSEVMKHFDELYSLLDLEDKLSKEIFEFLQVFPPQQRVQDLVRSTDRSEAEVFPLEKPYKLWYSLNAMNVCLEDVVLAQMGEEDFIAHSVQMLVSTLIQQQASNVPADLRLRLAIASSTVGALFLALKARVSAEGSSKLFVSDRSSLVRPLLTLISMAHDSQIQQYEGVSMRGLLTNAFSALLEASLHDDQIMDSLRETQDVGTLLLLLLLDDDRSDFRQAAAEVIMRISGPPPSTKISLKSHSAKGSAQESNAEASRHLLLDLWSALLPNLSKAAEKAAASEELFNVALALFQALGKPPVQDLDLNSYLREWGNLLLGYKHTEVVGRVSEDFFVSGLSRLLKLCAQIARSSGNQLDPGNLMTDVFNHLLFPELSPDSTSCRVQPQAPIQTTTTRQEIYDLVLLLCQDPERYNQMLESLEDLIPQDYFYDNTWMFDREKTILSPVGYAGLRNLSNTCYFNSLMTQLFMNVEFRDFVLQANIADANLAQRLLAETKKVFAHMQNTWLKSVDPQGMVDSIRTYDGESIDVNIQMDVDEFYNLLFDRWESQILSGEDKRKFRSFYGGQLVQQIKSRECPHISERLEPFSAIQCEIKGKSGLEESLRAYVQGEYMQGDNKYSCTSCGRHVDAVKRACLKDVPDHLIFHLKRFDFDIQTMMRSKINDEFQFPDRINMTPYTVEQLADENATIAPDLFELVGVLVHSGTAESGHYWSYIRERPTMKENHESWIEFNDSNVHAFEPMKINEQCFGGYDPTLQGFPKIHNAYMLFYQRVSSIEAVKSTYKVDHIGGSVKLPLPLDTENHIALENELYIRSYCLQDPRHAHFVRALLERMQWTGTRTCSSDHATESKALGVALQLIEQVISRSKDLPEFEAIVRTLAAYINQCSKCAEYVFEWLRACPEVVRNLLCRNPTQTVRVNFEDLLMLSIGRLRTSVQAEEAGTDPHGDAHYTYRQCVGRILKILSHLWKDMHMFARAWDQYFDLLHRIAALGPVEVSAILDNRFLENCLEIIWLDGQDSKKLRRHYLQYLRLREKGRIYSQQNLYNLVALCIQNVDLRDIQSDDEDRVDLEAPLQLTSYEKDLIYSIGQNRALVFLDKIISSQWNPTATHKIMCHMLMAEPNAGHLGAIQATVYEGVRKEPATRAVPFLDHALLFCQHAPSSQAVGDIIEHAIGCLDTLEGVAGKEHMRFVDSLTKIENRRLRRPATWFYKRVKGLVGDWAPVLLIYPEKIVREECFALVKSLIFDGANDERRPEAERERSKLAAKKLCDSCLEKLKRTYLVGSENDATPTVELSHMHRINEIIRFVAEHYCDSEEDAALHEKAMDILTRMGEITVEIPEEFVSDWDNESLMVSDSDGAGGMSP